MKPVQGGQYRPLNEEQIKKIARETAVIWKEVGVQVDYPPALEIFKQHGAKVDAAKRRVYLSEDLALSYLAKAPKEVLLAGRDPENDLHLGGTNVYLGTGGTALNILDFETGKKRRTSQADLAQICHLIDALENVHFIVLPVFPDDVPTEHVDVNRFYAGLSNSSKHIMGGVYTIEGVANVAKMGHKLAGGREAFRKRPICSAITCVPISPLKLDHHYGELMMAAIAADLPVAIPAEPLSGSTAPASLSGTVLLLNAEVLAALVLSQMVKAGAPVIYGCVASVSDMRTMGYTSGSVEMGLINAGAAQMAQHYHIPFYGTAGMSDSMLPDVQAGYEKATTLMLVALAGANYIHDAAGLLEFAMTVSLDQYVIDNEICGMAMRAVRGLETDGDHLAMEVIREVGPAGNFLAEEHTVRNMRQEFFFPKVTSRANRQEWEAKGSKDARQRAHEMVTQLLAEHKPLPIAADTLAWIKKEIPGVRMG